MLQGGGSLALGIHGGTKGQTHHQGRQHHVEGRKATPQCLPAGQHIKSVMPQSELTHVTCRLQSVAQCLTEILQQWPQTQPAAPCCSRPFDCGLKLLPWLPSNLTHQPNPGVTTYTTKPSNSCLPRVYWQIVLNGFSLQGSGLGCGSGFEALLSVLPCQLTILVRHRGPEPVYRVFPPRP